MNEAIIRKIKANKILKDEELLEIVNDSFDGRELDQNGDWYEMVCYFNIKNKYYKLEYTSDRRGQYIFNCQPKEVKRKERTIVQVFYE